jgi:hypothetical protein
MKLFILKIVTISSLFIVYQGFAQRVGISDNSTYNPDPKAILDLDATANNLGFLAPRMTEANRLSIAAPSEGLLVYQTDGAQGFYYWDQVAVSWIRIGSGGVTTFPLGVLQGDNSSTIIPANSAANNLTFWNTDNTISGSTDLIFDDNTDQLTLVGDFTSSSIIFDPGTQPGTPTEGQTYYDDTNDELRVWDGTQWVSLGGGTSTFPLGVVQSDASSNLTGATSTANNVTFWDTDNTISGSTNFTFDGTSDLTLVGDFTSTSIIHDPQASAPAVPTAGQTYFDSNDNELKVWNGTEWVSLSSQGNWTQTGLILEPTNASSQLQWGNNSSASGQLSTAWGNNSGASGQLSTAWGDNTLASAQLATAFGNNTEASAQSATAWGIQTVASGQYSTAFGNLSEATGTTSNAFGTGTVAKSFSETTVGTYNSDYTPNNAGAFDSGDRMFVVGVGSGTADRKDGLIVNKDATTELFGNLLLQSNTASASEARFYEPSASGTNYSAFKAQAQDNDINYTLPASLDTNSMPGGAAVLIRERSGNDATLSWVSNIAFGGSFVDITLTQAGQDYTATLDDFLIVITSDGATVDLPSASTSEGKVYYIALAPEAQASSGTVAANGSDTIETKFSNSSIPLNYGNGNGDYSGVLIVSDGISKWYVVTTRRAN